MLEQFYVETQSVGGLINPTRPNPGRRDFKGLHKTFLRYHKEVWKQKFNLIISMQLSEMHGMLSVNWIHCISAHPADHSNMDTFLDESNQELLSKNHPSAIYFFISSQQPELSQVSHVTVVNLTKPNTEFK